MYKSDGVLKLQRDERETALIYNEADGCWEIYTAVPKHIRRFDKLKYECIKTEFYENSEVFAKFYKVPAKAISFRDPTKKREISEESRKAAAERLKALHQKKENVND